MPEPPNTAIAVGKGVNQLQFIMKHAASDQHVQVAVLRPIQQFHDQIRHILRKCAEMQNMPLLIHNADGPRAEHAGFLHKPASHDTVSAQQVVHGVRVKLVQALVNLISVFDLSNIFGRSQNVLAVQNSGDLFQTQGVLLDGKGAVNGADTVGAAQIGIARKMIVRGKSAGQLRYFCNIVNDFVCNLKKRLFIFHRILTVSFCLSYHASLISSIIASLKMMDAAIPVFYKIPAFMPLPSAAFWDSLCSESHRSSARGITEITSILHAHRCTSSHALSVLIKLRVHWIYPRKCGIFDTTRSRISFARQHRKPLQIQGFFQKNAA